MQQILCRPYDIREAFLNDAFDLIRHRDFHWRAMGYKCQRIIGKKVVDMD